VEKPPYLDGRPRQSYVVCATPRSGSTLLCEALRLTGVAGYPEEPFETLRATGREREPHAYFDGVQDPTILDLLPELEPGPRAAPIADRVAGAFKAGTTPNGVFATKIMWGYFADFLADVRTLPGMAARDDAAALAALFPGVTYVHMTRRGRIDQAVSLWRALQTGVWRSDRPDRGRRAAYRFTGIDHLVRQLEAHELAWRRWFSRHGVRPATVVYEDLVDALEPTVRALLRHLGIDPPADLRIRAPALSRQADGRSAEWARRYAEDPRVVMPRSGGT
jgi:LPS sulfotransferase NodH